MQCKGTRVAPIARVGQHMAAYEELFSFASVLFAAMTIGLWVGCHTGRSGKEPSFA